jgi:hypothetical protein
VYWIVARCTIALRVAVTLLGLSLGNASAQDTAQIARGRYLVEGPAGCGDCHTSGGLSGKPDLTHYLGGTDVGLAVPGLGVFVPPNLTPDNETGLRNWTTEQIVTAFTKGREARRPHAFPGHADAGFCPFEPSGRPGGRRLSEKPQTRQERCPPGPFGPSQKIDVPVMILLPAVAYNRLLEER